MGKRHGQADNPFVAENTITIVFLPGFGSLLIPDTPTDQRLFHQGSRCNMRPQLIAAGKVLDERFPHRLKPRLHMTRYVTFVVSSSCLNYAAL